jgi:hypothetical protein
VVVIEAGMGVYIEHSKYISFTRRWCVVYAGSDWLMGEYYYLLRI